MMKVGPPISEFVARIVQNDEYQQIVDAIMERGGDLSKLVSAVNRHRHTVDTEDHDPGRMSEPYG